MHGRRLRGIKLGNFEYCADTLRLGNLAGNCFNLLMRRVEAEGEGVTAAMLEQQVRGASF